MRLSRKPSACISADMMPLAKAVGLILGFMILGVAAYVAVARSQLVDGGRFASEHRWLGGAIGLVGLLAIMVALFAPG
jgi:hypothetical protein